MAKTRKNTFTRRPSATKKRRTSPATKKGSAARVSTRAILPFFLSMAILICLGALGFVGYRTVTASDFFDVRRVDIRGAERASRQEIQHIVKTQTERSGVWNADLLDIKAKVERLPFVKTVAVSRVLPNGIRVNITEKIPLAVVRFATGDYLVDGEGTILAELKKAEEKLPFAMAGWDETKSEKAGKDNIERIKMYQKMLSEWKQFELASRVRMVNLADMREPRAVTEDSGATVSIAVGRENFGENLRRGISAIVGKGETFEAVNLVGPNMILQARKSK